MVATEFPCAALCQRLHRGKFKPDFKIFLYALYREPRDPAYSLAHTQKSVLEVQLGGKGRDLKILHLLIRRSLVPRSILHARQRTERTPRPQV